MPQLSIIAQLKVIRYTLLGNTSTTVLYFCQQWDITLIIFLLTPITNNNLHYAASSLKKRLRFFNTPFRHWECELHTLIHTFPPEIQPPHLRVRMLGPKVWIKGCNIKSAHSLSAPHLTFSMVAPFQHQISSSITTNIIGHVFVFTAKIVVFSVYRSPLLW